MSFSAFSSDFVKVKQEKLDPEIEEKLNPKLLLPDSTKQDPDGEAQIEEEKKNIEPVKSSNEILAELFMVFNATPPEELLSIDKSFKKSKKSHKKSKHKKSKKRKRKAEENSDKSEDEINGLETESNKLKRERHKRKHKKSKEKEETKSTAVSDGTVIMAADSSSSSNKRNSIKKERLDEADIKVEQSRSKNESRTRDERSIRNSARTEDCSDVSLSDEETYLRERVNYRERESDSCSKSSSKYERQRNSFYRSSTSYYSGDQRAERSHHRHHQHHNSPTRSPRRTRSRSRSKERSSLGIDKKRLLEIARKNAITMFKSGSLPGCDGMSEEVKDKVLMKMRYGGKTVEDLTNFCRKLSKGENYEDLSEFSSDEHSDIDKQGNAKVFHHPFVLKDREPIVMHIKNAIPITPKTADQKKAITMQFPVSSGQQHRLTEGWVPVTSKEVKPATPPPFSVKQISIKPLGIPKNVFQKQLPIDEQQPAFKPAGTNNDVVASAVENIAPMPIEQTTIAAPLIPPIIAPVVPVPSLVGNESSPVGTIFPAITPNIDVSTIISQRLSAMRRLQENPMDCEAIKMMYTSQKEMTSWASSKNMPGQFTGSTGANILSARELTKGTQAWARKDQMTSTVPVSGGMGMHLLKKMGWKPGEGLGREKTGSLQPLLLDVKLDKRGLVTDDEVNNVNRQQQTVNLPKRKKTPAKNTIDSKHPVCLLNELSSKRKWTPPMYELVLDEGPSHSKLFVFSVNVNGQVFNPGTGGNTKKEAKMLTAKFCLQQMGVLS